MQWRKLGRLYQPRPLHPKLQSHTANPLALWKEGDIYRVFYSGRDQHNRSSVGYVDVDIIKREVVYVHDSPVFEYGAPGSFHSHGVSIGNCYAAGGKSYMLFMGWHFPEHGHWQGTIGRLVLGEDWSLTLDDAQPFLGLDAADPISLSYPWVMQEGQGYRMWYGSTIAWEAGNGEMLHVLKNAISDDGHHWRRQGIAVPYALGSAQAFSRPTVLGNAEDGYHMWFSYRGNAGAYRIGCARSRDGESWERLNQPGIDVSTSGWDAEMIAYPFVFRHQNDVYMLYTGNAYGETGFGLAILDRWDS